MRYKIDTEIDEVELLENTKNFNLKSPEEKAQYNADLHMHIKQDLIYSGIKLEGLVITLQLLLEEFKKVQYHHKNKIKFESI